MKKSHLFSAALIAGLSVLSHAAAAYAPPQSITLPFGQRGIQVNAPKGMCFLDKTNQKQADFINLLRDQSWKGRKNVVMTLMADCREIASLATSKDPMPLSTLLIMRWLNPDIGEETEMIPNDYLDMREVSFRAHTANALTQFYSVKLEAEPKRTENAVAIGYVGTTMLDGAKYITVGVDATTLIQDIPVDITYMKTRPGLDHPSEDTAPLFKFADKFIDQQIALNAK